MSTSTMLSASVAGTERAAHHTLPVGNCSCVNPRLDATRAFDEALQPLNVLLTLLQASPNLAFDSILLGLSQATCKNVVCMCVSVNLLNQRVMHTSTTPG